MSPKATGGLASSAVPHAKAGSLVAVRALDGSERVASAPEAKSGIGAIPGRALLRLATFFFSLPTHREVVAAASRIAARGCYQHGPPAPVRPMLRVCVPRRRDCN
jgi:hypothetical protein